MRPLTQYEEHVLARLEASEARVKHGDGPWEPAFVHPTSAAEGAALGRLARLGLVERREGVSRRLPSAYRARVN